jgi:hypothetical protein
VSTVAVLTAPPSDLPTALGCAAVSAADIVRAALDGTVAYMHAYAACLLRVFYCGTVSPTYGLPAADCSAAARMRNERLR